MKRRRWGSGDIRRTPGGRYRVRFRVGGKRRCCGTYATLEEAEGVLRGLAEVAVEHGSFVGVPTLREFGPPLLEQRRLKGFRDVDNDVSLWRRTIVDDPIARLPVCDVRRRDVEAWMARVSALVSQRSGQPIARQTALNARNLLSWLLGQAVRVGHLDLNPAVGVTPERDRRPRLVETFTVLTLDEQQRLLAVLPTGFRRLVAFAIWVGLRAGEQFSLQLRDILLDPTNPHVVVRFGGPNQPTKGNRVRRAALIPAAVAVVREQLALRAGAGPEETLFVDRSGNPLTSEATRPLRDYLRQVGITRRVRWHDLRHTCGTSLLAGYWGHKWDFPEIAAQLGHQSVTTTERYAHFAQLPLFEAARETSALLLPDGPAGR